MSAIPKAHQTSIRAYHQEPTQAEILKRAEDLAPGLVTLQADTEKRTCYSEETHKAFERAGFYRMMVPRQFGGYEIDLITFHRVIAAISSGCPSTGWQLCLGTIHTLAVCALFDETVQAELFAGTGFICAATISPQGRALRQADGSWRISGVFNYASGIPYSTHFMSHALPIEPDGSIGPMMTFIVPEGNWESLNDWGHVLGLKGSGSHSVRIEDAHVPARFVLEQTDMLNLFNGGAARATSKADRGLARHGRLQSQFMLGPTALLLGMAKGALVEYRRIMATRRSVRPPMVPCYEHEDFRRWYGIAAGKLGMAEAALDDLSRQWTAIAERSRAGGDAFSAEEDLQLVASCYGVMQATWEAMAETLWPTAGTSAARDGAVMQRIYRDMSTARTHLSSSIVDGMRRDLGQAAFSAGR
jgi:3-hydroxy-9,10-secoandrosta-1,3,5(10)-triene-9,17-dione monooxygenase